MKYLSMIFLLIVSIGCGSDGKLDADVLNNEDITPSSDTGIDPSENSGQQNNSAGGPC